jgi:tetratricopeptide (TPR) repeat protein
MKRYAYHLFATLLLFSSASYGQTYQDYYNKGKAEKDPVKQVGYFSQAISIEKTDSALYYRGLAKHSQKQFAEAIADYDQAIRLNPYFKWAYGDRGRAKRSLKRYEEALADFDFTITLDKKYDFAYSNRGLIKYELDRYTDAVLDFDRAIEIDPDYSLYYLYRGWCYSELKKHREALADFEQVIKLAPGDKAGYYASGVEKVLLGRYQEAIADFDQVIKLAPDNAGAYNGRGFAKENLERYAAAIADYDKALQLEPKHEIASKNKIRAVKLRDAYAANQYNAEPLGYKLGVTPLSAVQQKDDEMQEDGYSYWTGGKKFISKGTVHNIEGANRISYIFNEEDLLDAIIIDMHKDYFHKVTSYLKGKYKLLSATVPFVGDKYAKYKQGNSIIEIKAPHLSFDMEVIYKTVNFDTALRNKKAAEAMEKRSEQKSKF